MFQSGGVRYMRGLESTLSKPPGGDRFPPRAPISPQSASRRSPRRSRPNLLPKPSTQPPEPAMAVVACELSHPNLTSVLRSDYPSSSAPSMSQQSAYTAAVSAYRARSRPIPNSYWATPNLVACEFPYCPLTPAQISHRQTKQKLDALLLSGVRTFVDLTEPHELFPYAPHLASRCALLGVDPREVEYHNFPIRDRSLPQNVDYVRKIMMVLRDTQERGRIAAVHCRGGIGRTGLVVGCWLVEAGIAKDGPDALRMIAEEWKSVDKCKRYPCSPETGPQFEWVRKWRRAMEEKAATSSPPAPATNNA